MKFDHYLGQKLGGGGGLPDRPADGREEVGVDEDVDTVELIENDGDLDADGAEAVPDDIE